MNRLGVVRWKSPPTAPLTKPLVRLTRVPMKAFNQTAHRYRSDELG